MYTSLSKPDAFCSLFTFAFSITDGKYPYWFGTSNSMFALVVAVFEEVAAVAFFFAFVVVVVFVADVFFFAD